MKVKSNKTLFKLAILGTLGMASTSALAFCPVTPISTTKPYWTALDKTKNTAFKTMNEAIIKGIQTSTDQLLGGQRVLTAQSVSNTEDIVKGIANNTKQQIANETALNLSENINKVKDEFKPSATGHNNCAVIKTRREIEKKSRNSHSATVSAMQQVTARAGHYASQPKALAVRLALHDMKYCTESQAEHGLCPTPAPRAGNSLTASTLFKPANQGDENDMDKDALINNMVGLPDNPISETQVKTNAGVAYQDAKRQKDAFVSPAIYTLKYLQTQYTNSSSEREADHDHDHAPKSVSEKTAQENAKDTKTTSETAVETKDDFSYSGMIKKDVEMHFGGGEAYIARQKYLVGATEKGILIETNKAQGLMKHQLQRLIEKEQQEILLVATLTTGLMRSQGVGTVLDSQRQSAQRQ